MPADPQLVEATGRMAQIVAWQVAKYVIPAAIIIFGVQLLYYYIRKKIRNSFKRSEGDNRCPKCGGLLVKRNGKFGSFLGCSNFPKCRYTQPIE